jgi:hypothetical protein
VGWERCVDGLIVSEISKIHRAVIWRVKKSKNIDVKGDGVYYIAMRCECGETLG